MKEGIDADAARHMARGKELYRAGDLEGAANSFASAARADPNDVEALFALGVVAERLGHREEALAHYESAVAVNPRMAKAHVNIGNLLRSSGDPDGARERYRAALEIDPGDAHALNNAAGLAFESREFDAARGLYERAVDCGSGEARLGLARTIATQGKELQRARAFRDAEAHYREALALEPRLAMARGGLGSIALERGQRDDAVALYREALAHDPRDFESLNNLACIALGEAQVAEAKRLFTAAAEVDPAQAEPRYNLGLIALHEQDFAAGWEAYELRTATDPGTVALRGSELGLPRLDATTLSNARRVAVRLEQGIGDQVLFSTLLPELVEKGIEAIVETDRRLVDAYTRSVAGAKFIAPSDTSRAFETCDYQILLGSLPRLFRPALESFSRQPGSLLQAEPRRVAGIEAQLPPRPRLAIAWRSFQKGRHRWTAEQKSAALGHFAVFAGEATLIDLQHGDVHEERAQFDQAHPGLRRSIDGLDVFNDLEGVLAAIASCDHVVTTSNAVAHFAGALGKPAWLVYLAARPPFHYWSPGADGRSLWYPSVEIVTDPEWKTWEPAFDALRERWRARGR